tara:strand:- start:876 stop:977 length:102 start_codon:yes stop_codon:yes gene_type:complete
MSDALNKSITIKMEKAGLQVKELGKQVDSSEDG